jgi:hypothetical protein
MAVDWLTIKTEYINDPESSYRKLAKKHGVSFGTLRARAERERWVEQRSTTMHEISTQAAQQIVEKTAEAISDEAASKARIRAHIMKLAEGWFESQVEHVAEHGKGAIDPTEFRKMVQSYKDMCEIDSPTDGDENGTGVVVIPGVIMRE